MQRVGLEWLFRLLQEPRRLVKRYAKTNTTFLLMLSRELITRRRSSHGMAP
jgi:N-acetylglucosaminyldiphosphoundecaprenol N-acetyl-beta-D-mannosaminyltransferase